MSVLATRANMAKYRIPPRNIGPLVVNYNQPIAYSPETGEEYSADPGDYWDRPLDKPLLDSEGEPMILVFRVTKLVDANEYDHAA